MKLHSFGKLFSLIAVLVLTLALVCISASATGTGGGEPDTASEGGMTLEIETYYNSCGKIRLSWDAVSGAAKYVVFIDGENIANTTDTFYITNTLEIGAKHSLKIVAVDANDSVLDFGTVAEAAAEHKYVAVVTDPTCTVDGFTTHTCSCGDSYVDTPVVAPGHTEGTPVTENNVAPTCTTGGGYDTVVYCTVCNAELSRVHTDVDATGHTEGTPVSENNVAPTCGVKGSYESVVYCTVCNAELSRETVDVDPTGNHTWDDATCTAPKTCSVCQATEGEALGHTGGTATCTDAPVCTACGESYGTALGHNYSKPDCENPGICSNCGGTNAAPLGHSWQSATCTTPKTCKTCNKTEGSSLGHNIVIDPAVEATCHATGLTEGKHCTRCDYSVEQTETPMLEHKFSPNTDPDVYLVYNVCELCGEEGKLSGVQIAEKDKDTIIKFSVVGGCALVIILCIIALTAPATTTPWYKRGKYRRK